MTLRSKALAEKLDAIATAAEAETPATPVRNRSRRTAPTVQTLPILPLRQNVLFPFTMTSLVIDTARGTHLVEEVVPKNRLVALVPALKTDREAETADDFFAWGCLGRIVKVLRFPDDTLRILVRGISRLQMKALTQAEPLFLGEFVEIQPPREGGPDLDALARNVIARFQEIISLAPNLPDDLKIALFNMDDYGRLADLVANTISLSFEEKLGVLKEPGIRARLEQVTVFLNREAETLKLGHEIQNKVNSAFSKHQREAFLREQLRVIQEQLNEEPDAPEIADLRKRVAAAGLPPEAKEAAERELDRLRRMHPANADHQVSRTYVEWLLALPWTRLSEDHLGMPEATRILDEDHYGLMKVKERILEFLAIRQLKNDARGPILCLVGPPGVGKTSLGKSIARALGREFVRISLGGIRDEAEIRGHRRTYIGSLPGRILQGIRRAKTANPVFMLDEIDKIGADFRGDPSAALLEALDPEQNAAFSDHYLEVPFDLSRVMFITTANLSEPILPALKDRMEILQIPGYTPAEKRQIAERFLIPRQMDACGLATRQVRFRTGAVDALISRYTFEAGVRNLERELGSVCRKVARRVVEGRAHSRKPVVVTPVNLHEFLGPQKLFPEMAITEPKVGVATGLAWTSAGGEVLLVEVTSVPGKGQLILTGSLGEVMKESAQIAFSFVRSRHADVAFDPAVLEKLDLHVHVPAGATPKDGPSAGVTIAVAITSLLGNRPVKPLLAMSGELSLRGQVLPVGGIKEKVLAAARAGVKTVLLPDKNRNDLEEIPAELRATLDFVFFSDGWSLLQAALMPRR